jgi:hypothetical protein
LSFKRGGSFLIKYISESGFVYYELPGGGQKQFERMEDSAKREFAIPFFLTNN